VTLNNTEFPRQCYQHLGERKGPDRSCRPRTLSPQDSIRFC
jgi:hypothetical protein